jgi:hypothetical protein
MGQIKQEDANPWLKRFLVRVNFVINPQAVYEARSPRLSQDRFLNFFCPNQETVSFTHINVS